MENIITNDILEAREQLKRTARIFEDVGGYYVCSEAGEFLDTRGPAYRTKADALRAATVSGYEYAVGSGTYWSGVRKIPSRFFV